MLLTDSNEKTARIPVKLIDGKFVNRITGKEVAEIENSSHCEIVVEANKVSDSMLLELLMVEETIELLPTDSVLYASVSPKQIPENLRRFAIGQSDKERQVEIKLLTPLFLKMRGTKPPILSDCECEIPSLREIDKDYEPAKSLNHAYRLISTSFEPHRRSFGGSVFLKLSIPPQQENKSWARLADLRDAEFNRYFDKLKEKYQEQITNKQETSLF